MLNPGNIDFFGGIIAVPAAGTVIYGPFENKAGALAAGYRCALETWGSGGSAVKMYIQTSFDKGNTWVDVICFTAAGAVKTRTGNLSKLTPVTTPYTPTDAALTDDTVKDGQIGDRWRCKVVVTGTYVSSTMRASLDLS